MINKLKEIYLYADTDEFRMIVSIIVAGLLGLAVVGLIIEIIVILILQIIK